MNISQCIFNQPDAIGIIRYGDLKEFALELIAETERNTEARLHKEKEKVEQGDNETRLFRSEVIDRYHISNSTLSRWMREGYLQPDGYIGRKPYYHVAKIERIIASKKGDL